MNTLTKSNFEEKTKSEKLTVVDFWASWCGPCRAFSPIFEDVASKYGEVAEFLKCNVDEERDLALKQGIMSIPCIIAFKGGKAVDRHVGLLSEEGFSAFIEKNL